MHHRYQIARWHFIISELSCPNCRDTITKVHTLYSEKAQLSLPQCFADKNQIRPVTIEFTWILIEAEN